MIVYGDIQDDILDFKEFYAENNVTPVSLDDLIKNSDVVTLHLPFDDSTKNIMNQKRLQMLKSNAILINLARGGLIDEATLKEVLIDNKIAGAALDVFEIEPPIDPTPQLQRGCI